MKNLKELLEETKYSNEEYKIYKKVEQHYQLEDLKYLLDDMLENDFLTQEEYDKACENADWIIEKYNKWVDYDWKDTMHNAINYILGDK